MLTHKINNDPLMELYLSSSIEQLNNHFKIICENYFIEKFALAAIVNINIPSSQKFLTFDNYPSEWMNYYKKQKYYLDDPVFQKSKQVTFPCSWSINKFSDLNEHQKKILTEASDFNIKGGTIIPLLPNGKRVGLLSIIGSNIHHPEALYTLSNATHIYLNRKEDIEFRKIFDALTDKEMQILVMKAEGYSIKQISSNFAISNSTVLFHLKNIRKKLGSVSTDQAIFKYHSIFSLKN